MTGTGEPAGSSTLLTLIVPAAVPGAVGAVNATNTSRSVRSSRTGAGRVTLVGVPGASANGAGGLVRLTRSVPGKLPRRLRSRNARNIVIPNGTEPKSSEVGSTSIETSGWMNSPSTAASACRQTRQYSWDESRILQV